MTSERIRQSAVANDAFLSEMTTRDANGRVDLPGHEPTLPITVLVAVRNEEPNISRCLAALRPAERVVLIDSKSTDRTQDIAREYGAEIVQFVYAGGYPKKRQWALDNLVISTAWIFLLDADEVVPNDLWEEIREAISKPDAADAFLMTKGFHFLGRRLRFGGFSFAAVLLFRRGRARFERLDEPPCGLDMEVHERLIVDGRIERLRTPVIHEDFKGLDSYIAKHNRYSTWEASVRDRFKRTGLWGPNGIREGLLGNTQERRRWLKRLAIRMPFEPALWFLYHYILRLGLLEGQRGLIASSIRAAYISQVRAKVYELGLARRQQPPADVHPGRNHSDLDNPTRLGGTERS